MVISCITLPLQVRAATSVDDFKTKLKTHLFVQTYGATEWTVYLTGFLSISSYIKLNILLTLYDCWFIVKALMSIFMDIACYINKLL